jgi:hypothetical protein
MSENGHQSKIGCGKLIGIGVAALIAVIVVDAVIGPSQEERLEQVKKDAAAAISERDMLRRTAMRVSAAEMQRAFKENEIAALQRYKGKAVVVSGVVDSIDADVTDKPVVRLLTDEMFSNVSIKLEADQVKYASALAKGVKVSFLCLKVTEVIGSPYLDDCTPEQ